MKIAIVGIGLIGGSMALDSKRKKIAKTVIGVDNSPEHAIKALSLGIIDKIASLEEALQEADLIILATPVDVIVEILPKILDKITEKQIVIDVGSTKRLVVKSVENHTKRGSFVSTHPMAGTEYSGPEAALENLFQNKLCVLCETNKSYPAAVEKVKKIYQMLGMNLFELNAEEHDIHTAYISHISHICSFALALTVLEKEKDENRIFELAGTGFSSTVRLAKSSPDTWVPIFRQNADNVLDALDEYINTLLKFKGLMLSEGYSKLHQEFEKANQIKKILG